MSNTSNTIANKIKNNVINAMFISISSTDKPLDQGRPRTSRLIKKRLSSDNHMSPSIKLRCVKTF